MRHALALAALALVAGCRSCGEPGVVDAGPTGLVLKRVLDAELPADPIAAIASRVAAWSGACAQVRSLKDEKEARKIGDAIRATQALPVDIVRADLGDKGVWFRLCVGHEDSEARLIALATRWTAPGGELERYLDPPVEGRPRFHVFTRASAEERTPTAAQASALLAFELVAVPERGGEPGVETSIEHVRFFGGPAQDALLLAGTARTEDGSTDIIVVDASGRRVPLIDTPPPGCASCTLALREGSVRARTQVAAGDVAPQTGDELLVQEDTDRGVRLLSLLAFENGALVRVAGLLLQHARPGYAQLGDVAIVEADADHYQEVVLATRELRTQPAAAGAVACALEAHAIVYDLGAAGFVRLDPLKMADLPQDAVINVVTALDAHGDHETASRACAVQLSRAPQAATAQLCLQRVRRLIEAGSLIDAVNAAGLAAEASPSLRAVIAAPFHAAASALDRDARLFAGEEDCARSPLVEGLEERTLLQSVRIAEAKQRERVPLGHVADAVFVTGARDFGPSSPVGAITARWLERVRVALPAKGAAIDALLLPQAPDADPPASADVDAGMGAGFGGGP